MQLEEIIQEKVNLLVANGSVEKMIEVHITKCIDSALNDLLRDYSEFGKQVKAAIGKKLEISLDKLNISAYTTMVCNTIESTLTGITLESSIHKIKTHTTAILEQIEKKEWKLSEICVRFMEAHWYSGKELTHSMEIVNHEWGSTTVRFFENKKYSHSGNGSFEISLDKKENKVYYITSGGNPLDPRSSTVHRFQAFVMQLWANECIIEVNEDEAQEVIEYWGQN